MQLRKPHAVSVVNYERVCVRNVHTRLDDGGAHEHVDPAVGHIGPDLLKALLFHLTVRGHNGRVGYLARYLSRDTVYRLDRVVEIKHLTAAAQLTLYRVDDDYIVVLEHVCLDRQTVAGRLVKHRYIAYPRHCHVESARDRRCAERENVNVPRRLLYLFFLRHTEALLLIDDEQTEIVELYIA